MSVARSIKFVVLLLALMAGLPTVAFAHPGHKHTARAAGSPESFSTTNTAQGKSQTAKPFSLVARPENSGQGGLAFENSSSGSSIVLCTPGSCCCQGASSCGTGYCCSFGITCGHTYGTDLHKVQNYRLAFLGWSYPDLIFALDRPPKI